MNSVTAGIRWWAERISKTTNGFLSDGSYHAWRSCVRRPPTSAAILDCEHEGAFLGVLDQALAARNSGGSGDGAGDAVGCGSLSLKPQERARARWCSSTIS